MVSEYDLLQVLIELKRHIDITWRELLYFNILIIVPPQGFHMPAPCKKLHWIRNLNNKNKFLTMTFVFRWSWLRLFLVFQFCVNAKIELCAIKCITINLYFSMKVQSHAWSLWNNYTLVQRLESLITNNELNVVPSIWNQVYSHLSCFNEYFYNVNLIIMQQNLFAMQFLQTSLKQKRTSLLQTCINASELRE